MTDKWSDDELTKQLTTCERAGVQPEVPSPEQFGVITPGVYEGSALDCVRYRPDGDASGWWFITSAWDGTTETAHPVHLRHISEFRPELVQFLALPPGHCVRYEDSDSIAITFELDALSD